MRNTKIHKNANPKTICLLRKDCFTGNECVIQPLENTEQTDIWESFVKGINSFTDDFFKDGRIPAVPIDRAPD